MSESARSNLAAAVAGLPPLETAEDVAAALGGLVGARHLELPFPASGRTAARFDALSDVSAADLSLGRLAEGHTDARAILAEARIPPRWNDVTYGVWAAEPPDARVTAERTPAGWILRGRKRYASGARGIDRALVTAACADGGRLFDVDVRGAGAYVVEDSWRAVGMAATESLEVVFDGVTVGEADSVGPPGFYLERPGFWHGAVGVAACWYGGALARCAC